MNLESPSWQGVGALLTAIGILVALLIYWLQKPRRAISYLIGERRPLVSPSAGQTLGLTVLKGSEKLDSPMLLSIVVTNSGRNEIEASDFHEPLIVIFQKPERVYSAYAQSNSSSAFRVDVHASDSTVKVDPLLLNRGDSFEIVCLTNGGAVKPTLTARIKGVTKLQRLAEQQLEVKTHLLGSTVFAAGILSVLTVIDSKQFQAVYTAVFELTRLLFSK